jgi:hypothetical protein
MFTFNFPSYAFKTLYPVPCQKSSYNLTLKLSFSPSEDIFKSSVAAFPVECDFVKWQNYEFIYKKFLVYHIILRQIPLLVSHKSPYLCILSSTASAAPAYGKSVEIYNWGKFRNGKFIGYNDNLMTTW